MRSPLIALVVALSAPVAAQAQVHPWQAAPYGQPLTTADVHRLEMDRLRATAQANAALAERQRLQSQLTIRELQARRLPEPVLPETTRRLRSPEEERAAREAATARRETVTRQATEIDAWLDREPR